MMQTRGSEPGSGGSGVALEPAATCGRWYAVQTLACREAGAAIQLGGQGFRVFLPQFLKTVRHARKLRTVRASLFPGYLFIELDLDRDRWRSVNGTFNVSRLVMAGDRPLAVPAGVVERLMACVDGAGVCRLDSDLREGQLVRVTRGPFSELMGRIASLDDRGRARVLLEIMGGAVVTHVARSALEAA
jgi:transcription antitermination factor NusG